jgi:hypothetical protein
MPVAQKLVNSYEFFDLIYHNLETYTGPERGEVEPVLATSVEPLPHSESYINI